MSIANINYTKIMITFCIHCSPVAGLSGWMYILFGISGSAFPATIHRLQIENYENVDKLIAYIQAKILRVLSNEWRYSPCLPLLCLVFLIKIQCLVENKYKQENKSNPICTRVLWAVEHLKKEIVFVVDTYFLRFVYECAIA